MSVLSCQCRAAVPQDAAAIRDVLERAFPSAAEARLVAALGAAGRPVVERVAEVAGTVVGYLLFTPVTRDGVADGGLGLAPVAVAPGYQGRGVGRRLIVDGLAECRRRHCPYVVVLGAPGYYQRVGFRRASAHGLGNEYGCDDEFMVLALHAPGLPAGGGLIRYAPEFDELGEA